MSPGPMTIILIKKENLGIPWCSSGWDSELLLQGAWVPSLVSSVQFSRSVMSNSLRPHGLQHREPLIRPCKLHGAAKKQKKKVKCEHRDMNLGRQPCEDKGRL